MQNSYIYMCSGFIQGALDIFNSPTVIARTSNFTGNGFATTVKPDSYRGHAGAISIGETVISLSLVTHPSFTDLSLCVLKPTSRTPLHHV